MAKEPDFFWKLLEPEYFGAMMFCRKLIGDRDLGDDLYQDALVIAVTKIGDLRDPKAFRPWLYSIIVSTFKSTIRRPWFKRRKPYTDEIEHSLTTADPTDSITARRLLGRAFENVAPDDQALVTLHELDGWSVADLAELYQKTEGAIKARLFRARRRMKKTLTALLRRTQILETSQGTNCPQREPCAVTKPGTE